MPSIIIVAGPNEQDYYPLGTRTWVIGRGEQCPIQIVDDLVSRRHCQIRFESADDRYHCLDMNSANGVFINGRQITSETILEDGDTIEIGNSKMMFTKEEFKDRESAINHWKQRGEKSRSTLIR